MSEPSLTSDTLQLIYKEKSADFKASKDFKILLDFMKLQNRRVLIFSLIYTENKNRTTPNPKGFVGLKKGFALSTEPKRVSISFQFSEPFLR